MYLNYLWPVSFLFSILNSLQGTPIGAAAMSDDLMTSNIPCLWKWEVSGKILCPQIKHTHTHTHTHTRFYYGFLTFNSLKVLTSIRTDGVLLRIMNL